VSPQALSEPRFVADGHLGTLARYLRLLGFDTGWDAAWSEVALATRSAQKPAVLLTRDRGLLRRRTVSHGMFVRSDDPDEQLLDVVRRYRLATNIEPFTRCMACNGALDDVDKAAVVDRLPSGTRAAFHRFRRCRECRRVYWEGAHHRRLVELIERARAADG
jgi:uncharacterized protein with PIN domain